MASAHPSPPTDLKEEPKIDVSNEPCADLDVHRMTPVGCFRTIGDGNSCRNEAVIRDRSPDALAEMIDFDKSGR